MIARVAPTRRARADHRRVGHGQGARRGGDPRGERASRPAVRARELRGDSARPRRERDVRPRARRVHRRDRPPHRTIRARASRARCFSTKSATSAPRRRPSCSAPSRRRRSSASAARKPIRVDVRIVSATNKDLARAVHDGTFREDLLFRLNVIPIPIPPLRERPGDIPALVRHFSALHRMRTGTADADVERRRDRSR